MAKELSKRPGMDISFVVFDHGQALIEDYNGIKVFANPARPSRESRHERAYRNFWSVARELRGGKWPGFKALLGAGLGVPYLAIKKFHPEALINPCEDAELKLLRKINADAYATFGVTDFAQELFERVAKLARRKILFSGSDFDFSETYTSTSQIINNYGSRGDRCYQAIQSADQIFVQTVHQGDLLKQRFGRTATVIRNVIDLGECEKKASPLAEREFVLWVGKSDNVKKPQRVLELARLTPSIRYFMVMNKSNLPLFEQIFNDCPSNVQIVEQVPFEEIDRLFARSWILLNTSEFEGFPNTFLQSAKAGIPILSWFVDPDQFIRRERCGVIVDGDVRRAAEFLTNLSQHETEWREMSERLKAYAKNYHELNRNVDQLRDQLISSPQHGSYTVLPGRERSGAKGL